MWHDPPASPRSRRALVNDLDLVLLGEDGATILPTIVGGAQGVDTLNNVEQVRRERKRETKRERATRRENISYSLWSLTMYMFYVAVSLPLSVTRPHTHTLSLSLSLSLSSSLSQVYIANPVVGQKYTVQVKGTRVPQGPQPYSVVVTGSFKRSSDLFGSVAPVREHALH